MMLSDARATRLESLGFPLDRLPPEGTLFDPIAIAGRMVYVSGQVPFDGSDLVSVGKVPGRISQADATRAAALCAANALRVMHKHLGSLARIERVVRITGYVNTDADFTDQHLVIHGASQLVLDVFGDAGRHARTAIGVAQLPLGSSVELELFALLAEDRD